MREICEGNIDAKSADCKNKGLRGYERMEAKLKPLGARIERVK